MRGNNFYEYTYLIIKKSRCHHCSLIEKLREMHLTTNRCLKTGVENWVVRKRDSGKQRGISSEKLESFGSLPPWMLQPCQHDANLKTPKKEANQSSIVS